MSKRYRRLSENAHLRRYPRKRKTREERVRPLKEFPVNLLPTKKGEGT
jgi:hypothetical protein